MSTNLVASRLILFVMLRIDFHKVSFRIFFRDYQVQIFMTSWSLELTLTLIVLIFRFKAQYGVLLFQIHIACSRARNYGFLIYTLLFIPLAF